MASQRDFSYFPYQHRICHHVYNKGGCTFCGFHLMKRCVSSVPVSDEQMIQHFDAFVSDENNLNNLLKAGKILVETNGSWFIEMPKAFREHVYKFAEANKIELHTQCRATVIHEGDTRESLRIMANATHSFFPEYMIKSLAHEAFVAIDTELRPYMRIFTGLEVANDADLELINKGCELRDFFLFAEFVRFKGAQVGANVLIAPPLVRDPVYKALMTAKYGFEKMNAKEVAFGCCIPRLGTVGHKLWRAGKWNPLSMTECSEILKQTRKRFPSKEVSLYNSRVQCFHGKYAKPRIKTDRQKVLARANVRRIAQEVFN